MSDKLYISMFEHVLDAGIRYPKDALHDVRRLRHSGDTELKAIWVVRPNGTLMTLLGSKERPYDCVSILECFLDTSRQDNWYLLSVRDGSITKIEPSHAQELAYTYAQMPGAVVVEGY